jgi:hypothetical protein
MGSDHLPRNIDTTSKLGVTVGTNKLCGSDGSQVCMTAATWLIVRLIKQKHPRARRVRPSLYRYRLVSPLHVARSMSGSLS